MLKESAKSSDQEIAEGLTAGSPEAFRKLYQEQGRGVLTYLMRLTGRKEMAEELTQETFLTVIRKISFFKGMHDGSLKAWIYRIASHLAIDSLRREKKIVLKSKENDNLWTNKVDDQPNAEEKLESFEFSEALHSALLKLTPAQRMIFLLKEQEEMSLLEISRVCGCNENAIKQSLFRTRTALRRNLCP